jgi:hypothetical protein
MIMARKKLVISIGFGASHFSGMHSGKNFSFTRTARWMGENPRLHDRCFFKLAMRVFQDTDLERIIYERFQKPNLIYFRLEPLTRA